MKFFQVNQTINLLSRVIHALLFTIGSSKFLFALFMMVMISSSVQAQLYGASNPGNFGIDGDIFTSQKISGSFNAAGTDDWFSKAAAKGLSMFDTIGADNTDRNCPMVRIFLFIKKCSGQLILYKMAT